MEDGKLKTKSGKWKVEDGKWKTKVKDGKGKTECRSRKISGKRKVEGRNFNVKAVLDAGEYFRKRKSGSRNADDQQSQIHQHMADSLGV